MSGPARILLTGANGFAGRYLLDALARRFPGAVLVACEGPSGRSTPLDVTDPAACRAAIAEGRPDAIVHLGGKAAVAAANADPLGTMAVNGTGARHMLEAALAEAPGSLFILVSSSEVYGESLAGGLPTPESAPCRPLSPYAESKFAAEASGREAAARGLHVVIARPFNHAGPGQSTDFVVPAFAAQIAAIEAGEREAFIDVGWLSDVRDFSDVRDIAAGYAALVAQGRGFAPGSAVNFATGLGRPISEVLERLLALSPIRPATRIDAARLRPSRLPAMVGDAGLAASELFWRPNIAFETTLLDVLNAYRRGVNPS